MRIWGIKRTPTYIICRNKSTLILA